MILMYGGPPEPEKDPPRFPREFVTVSLAPCPKCGRHIYFGTECPFCFAESVRAPTREALLAAEKALQNARQVINEALAMVKEALK